MIYITGDTHGDMSRIVRFCERMETYGAGITPLLDSEGKVIVTKSNSSLHNS